MFRLVKSLILLMILCRSTPTLAAGEASGDCTPEDTAKLEALIESKTTPLKFEPDAEAAEALSFLQLEMFKQSSGGKTTATLALTPEQERALVKLHAYTFKAVKEGLKSGRSFERADKKFTAAMQTFFFFRNVWATAKDLEYAHPEEFRLYFENLALGLSPLADHDIYSAETGIMAFMKKTLTDPPDGLSRSLITEAHLRAWKLKRGLPGQAKSGGQHWNGLDFFQRAVKESGLEITTVKELYEHFNQKAHIRASKGRHPPEIEAILDELYKVSSTAKEQNEYWASESEVKHHEAELQKLLDYLEKEVTRRVVRGETNWKNELEDMIEALWRYSKLWPPISGKRFASRMDFSRYLWLKASGLGEKLPISHLSRNYPEETILELAQEIVRRYRAAGVPPTAIDYETLKLLTIEDRSNNAVSSGGTFLTKLGKHPHGIKRSQKKIVFEINDKIIELTGANVRVEGVERPPTWKTVAEPPSQDMLRELQSARLRDLVTRAHATDLNAIADDPEIRRLLEQEYQPIDHWFEPYTSRNWQTATDVRTRHLNRIIRDYVWPKMEAFEMPALGPQLPGLKALLKRYRLAIAHPTNEDLQTRQQIENLVSQVYQEILTKHPGARSLDEFSHYLVRDPATGTTVSLSDLLHVVAVPVSADTIWGVRRLKTVPILAKHKELLQTVMQKEIARKTKDGTDPEAIKKDIEAFLATNPNITALLEAYAHQPALLTEMLQELHESAFQNRSVSDFVVKYVGLNADKIGERVQQTRDNRSRNKGEDKSAEVRRAYIDAVVEEVKHGHIPGDPETLQRPLEHLIRLSRLDFQRTPQSVIDSLRKDADTFRNRKDLPEASRDYLTRLHLAAAEHFAKISRFDLSREMKTPPFEYQKEGAKFLTERDTAILSDEAGLGKTYQVIAAAEKLQARKVLIVTTASNKSNIADEILEHSNVPRSQVKVIEANNPRARKAQVEALNGTKYIVINYDQLSALYESDRASYDLLTKDLDILVADEGHLADNDATDRAKALYGVQSPKKWVLSATPYQNKVDRLFNILNFLRPDEFPSPDHFTKEYTQDAAGLHKLHSRLSDVMLRRKKSETVEEFEDPEKISFADQIKGSGARLPKLVRQKQAGEYELLPEQTRILAQMTEDYGTFAKEFNRNLPAGINPLPERANPLQKFHLMQDVIYRPERFAISGENPLYRALDQQVADAIARNEKVILWGFNKEVLDEMQRRYGGFGTARIDGDASRAEKDQARKDFQSDPNTRVMIANYRSGGVGLTLTAANRAIYVQLPHVYSEYYQSEGRHHRVIGENNLHLAKAEASVTHMVPKYDPATLLSTTSPTARAAMAPGTLVEQTVARLEGGELIYQMVIDGHADPEQVQNYFNAHVVQALTDPGRLKDAPAPPLTEVTRTLLPVIEKLRKEVPDSNAVYDVVDLLAKSPKLGQPIAEALAKQPSVSNGDLELIRNLFAIRNQYVREQALQKLPLVLSRLRESGKSLADEAKGLAIGKLTATQFLGSLLTKNIADPFIRSTTKQMETELKGNSPANRALHDRFQTAVVNIVGTPGESRLPLLSQSMANASLEAKIDALYQLSLASRIAPDEVQKVLSPGDLERVFSQTMARWIGSDPQKVHEAFQKDPKALETALAMGAGFKDWKNPRVWEQYRESMRQIVDGKYQPWRDNGEGKQAGNHPRFPVASAGWWAKFRRDDSLKTNGWSSEKSDFIRDIRWHREKLKQNPNSTPEGANARTQIERFASADATQRGRSRALWENALEALRQGHPEKLKATHSKTDPTNVEQVNAARQDLENLLAWADVLDAEAATKENKPLPPTLDRSFQRLDALYRAQNQTDSAERWQQMRALIPKLSERGTTSEIKVEETSDPFKLLQQGQLGKDLRNCFNQDGNPEFNQYVIGTLGSPNIKMLIARDEEGKAVGVAMMKIKKLKDGTPVLYLEHGMESGKKAVAREALEDFVIQKAKDLSFHGVKTIPATEPTGNKKDLIIEVEGTGAYTDNEYVESVFGLRRSDRVVHRGRRLD